MPGEGQADESEGPPDELERIIAELSQPSRIEDMDHRAELCRSGLTWVRWAEHPELWGALQNELGNSLLQNRSADRAPNIELAIQAYKAALEVQTREAFPLEWAET